MVDSSVEAWFRTRKNLIDAPISPARYINETIHETLGQCKRSSKHLVSEDEDEENNPVEATKFNALDMWGKKKKRKKIKVVLIKYQQSRFQIIPIVKSSA